MRNALRAERPEGVRRQPSRSVATVFVVTVLVVTVFVVTVFVVTVFVVTVFVVRLALLAGTGVGGSRQLGAVCVSY